MVHLLVHPLTSESHYRSYHDINNNNNFYGHNVKRLITLADHHNYLQSLVHSYEKQLTYHTAQLLYFLLLAVEFNKLPKETQTAFNNIYPTHNYNPALSVRTSQRNQTLDSNNTARKSDSYIIDRVISGAHHLPPKDQNVFIDAYRKDFENAKNADDEEKIVSYVVENLYSDKESLSKRSISIEAIQENYLKNFIEANADVLQKYTQEADEYKENHFNGKNPYEVLNIPENSSEIDIIKAYKAAYYAHHPDRGGNIEDFRMINLAGEQLVEIQELKKIEKKELPHEILGIKENADRNEIDKALSSQLSKLDNQTEIKGFAKKAYVDQLVNAYAEMRCMLRLGLN